MKAITTRLKTKTEQHFDRDLKSTVEAFEKKHQFISASIYMNPGVRNHYLSRFISPNIPFTIHRKEMELKIEVNEETYIIYEDEILQPNFIRIEVDHKKKVIKKASQLVTIAKNELTYRADLQPYVNLTFNQLETTADTLEYYLCNPRRGGSRMGLPSALNALNALIKFTESKTALHIDWLILNFRFKKIRSTYPKYFNNI